jgi:hypothetical protein
MSDTPEELRPGWSVPKPAVTSRPTVWPAAHALGVMLFAWGIVTSLIIFLIGAGVLMASIGGWIGEIRHERKHAP